jgi:cysteine synthase
MVVSTREARRRLTALKTFDTPAEYLSGNLLSKHEFLHPLRSHKGRAAIGMLERALDNDGLTPDRHCIIEKTGGNLGVALAIAGRMLGFDVALAIGRAFPDRKRKLLRSAGAELLGEEQIQNGVAPAEVIEQTRGQPLNGKTAHFTDQFGNPGVVDGFRDTLAADLAERARAWGGTVHLVKGAGTGGSSKAILDAMAERGVTCRFHLIEPAGSSFARDTYDAHALDGISVGRRPPFLDLERVDETVAVIDDEGIEARRRLLLQHGLFVGTTSAANHAVAERIAQRYPNDLVVTVLYDRGEDYDG